MTAVFALLVGLVTSENAFAADPVHVTCVGDSITFGSGTTTPSTDAYPAQLQKLLGAGYAVQNDGRGGATLLVAGDLPYTAQAEYAASTAWAAAGGDVVIQLGTNDSKPSNWTEANKAKLEGDCESLVAHYQVSTIKPRVWVNLPPPAFPPSCCTISGPVIQNEIIPLLKQCAAAKGASTIDVFGALSGAASHFSDGVHPDNTGAQMIAQAVQSAITKVPTVSLSAAAVSFKLPAPIALKANAVAAYGKIEQVEIFEGTTSVAKSASLEPSVTLPAGTHALYAVVTETGGRTAKSSPPISVIVEAAAPGTLPAPGPGPSPSPRATPSPAADGGAVSSSNGSSSSGCAMGSPNLDMGIWCMAIGLIFMGLARRRLHLRRPGVGRF